LALQLEDVTADGLVIRETKFQKSRLLPLHATVRQALDRYLIDRRKVSAADRALFISVGGRASCRPSVRAAPRRTATSDGQAASRPQRAVPKGTPPARCISFALACSSFPATYLSWRVISSRYAAATITSGRNVDREFRNARAG
jgi:hypothetical protein